MTADIHEACGGEPRRRSVMVIRNTQRGVMVAEQVEDIILVPARMAKLERIGPLGAEQLEERCKPLAVLLELRRQLKQDRSGFCTKQPQTGLHQRNAVSRGVV